MASAPSAGVGRRGARLTRSSALRLPLADYRTVDVEAKGTQQRRYELNGIDAVPSSVGVLDLSHNKVEIKNAHTFRSGKVKVDVINGTMNNVNQNDIAG